MFYQNKFVSIEGIQINQNILKNRHNIKKMQTERNVRLYCNQHYLKPHFAFALRNVQR